MPSYLLSVLTFLPLAGTAAILLLNRDDHTWIRRVALAIAMAEFLLSLALLHGFAASSAAYQFQETRGWIPSPPIHYHLGVDGISLFLVLLTTFLTPVAMLASWNSVQHRVQGFFITILILETGVIGVFVALDLFLFFLFWEAMLIPMYFLIGIWGHHRRIYAALKFILYTMFGSILMFVAIIWLYELTGTFDLPRIQAALTSGQVTLPMTTELLLFGAFFLAFAVKVPMFPFHTWLPDAHTEAPTAGSVILAGIMLKMGTYGFLRFALPLFPGAALTPWVRDTILTLAVIGIIYGALVAMVQPDFKKLVAYSSVSHLGFVMLGIFALTLQSVQGALMVMINHGISTGALFLLIGMIYERKHTRLIDAYGGIARVVPMFAVVLTLVSLSSIGLPGTNGFVGEFLVLIGSFKTHPWFTLFATTGVIFAACYLLWAIQRILFNKLDKPENAVLSDLNRREVVIVGIVAAAILWIGIYPAPVLRRMERSAQNFVQVVTSSSGARLAS